jgi:hypothetical protein
MLSKLMPYVASLAAIAHASDAPSYSGYSLIWQDNFAGSGGTLPNQGNWNIISGDLGVNGELETYRDSTTELQLSGGSTLQIVPWEDSSASGGWSSGRIESTYVFTPAAGEVTRAEASIRFGTNPMSEKQGIWPAFWMLGDSIRQGTAWPECGELDIMEQIDGQLVGHGTMHCDVASGGICNEPNGIGSAVQMPDQSWHTWRLEWDRTSGNWEDETITWSFDGSNYQTITGSQIGDENVWSSVCHDNVYFILNVAVGGDWVSHLDPYIYTYIRSSRTLANMTSARLPKQRHHWWLRLHDGGLLRRSLPDLSRSDDILSRPRQLCSLWSHSRENVMKRRFLSSLLMHSMYILSLADRLVYISRYWTMNMSRKYSHQSHMKVIFHFLHLSQL